MIRTVIISADQVTCSRFEALLEGIQAARLVRVVDSYPEPEDVVVFLRTTAPEAIILDFQALEVSLTLAARIQEFAPGVQIIGFHPDCDSQQILPILRAGARELLTLPLDRSAIESALLRAAETLERLPPLYPPSGDLYCFLPVKGGVGATTLAVNTAAALRSFEGSRPLLADFDLNAGMVRFLLKLHNWYSTEDAVEQADHLDGPAWSELVSNLEGLDVLHTGKLSPDRRIVHSQIRHLTDFTMRLYTHVLIDLSPNLETYAQHIMQTAKRVFLVTTPEIPAVYLAREKVKFLQNIELGGRVSLMINRYHRGAALSPAQIEATVAIPLAATIPNDYKEAQAALTAGRPVNPNGILGQGIHKFAVTLAGIEERAKAAKSGFRLPYLRWAGI
jgi:pilus assembly protein CpaE